MKNLNPKISYDPDADVLAFAQPTKARIDYAQELGNFVVHFTKDGRPVLIEVLDASKAFSASPKPLRQMSNLVFA